MYACARMCVHGIFSKLDILGCRVRATCIGMTMVPSDYCRILGMRRTEGESGVELVSRLAKGSKEEGRLTALERFEGR